MDDSPYRKDEWPMIPANKKEDYYWMSMKWIWGKGFIYQVTDGNKVLGEGSTPWDARINAGIQDD